MRFTSLFRPLPTLAALYVLATLVPVTALVWLGWRLLEQDRALENQRIQERLENAIDLVAGAIERRLADFDKQLVDWRNSPPKDLANDALLVVLGPKSLTAYPPGRLLYRPVVDPAPEAPDSAFKVGEAYEFRDRQYLRAAAVFSELAKSGDPLIRAGALVRLARNLRKAGQSEKALPVYDELAGLASIYVGDTPAGLLGRHARCVLLHQLGRKDEIIDCASRLFEGLQRGRWPLDRAGYEFFLGEAERWLAGRGARDSDTEERRALAGAVEELWKIRLQIRGGTAPAHGEHSFWITDRSILVLWNGTPENSVALVAGPRYLASEWKGIWEGYGVRLTLSDPDGRYVFGRPSASGELQAVRTPAETRLPWTLHASSAESSRDLARLAARRRLLLASLAVMSLLILACGYLNARAVRRELAVARLQSDLVSAVSHEFRSPLTSMRHLTELLERGIVEGEDRRKRYYAVLARETRRLHRLVESLLNFGRIEAGKAEYRFEKLDAATLVREVVEEFQGEIANTNHRIEVSIAASGGATIRGDREALGRALWNLLDNAVKYSPGCPTVWVELVRDLEHIAIRVRDQGTGIAIAEQKEIFKKFVRGAASKISTAKGAGIGLAMVQHIVEAHEGEVRVESRPGQGSTFTILLPAGSPDDHSPETGEEVP
jgi:signal transduction histidine kinase